MNIERMIDTDWKSYREDCEYRIRARYGMHYIDGNARPYFSLTATTERRAGSRWLEYGGGCMHDEIAKHFPELAPLIKWHLCDQDGTPMHYLANGAYWFKKIGQPKERSYDPDPLEAFKNTIVFGSVNGDEMPEPETTTTNELRAWLDARLPALREQFARELSAAGVRFIEENEYR